MREKWKMQYEYVPFQMKAPHLIGRRSFLARGVLGIAAVMLPAWSARRSFAANAHRYTLAPEALLPVDVRKAPEKVREAYRFAIANRDVLRYIPCYCGCGAQGHTSNASCYLKDSSTPGNLVFDRMSLN